MYTLSKICISLIVLSFLFACNQSEQVEEKTAATPNQEEKPSAEVESAAPAPEEDNEPDKKKAKDNKKEEEKPNKVFKMSGLAIDDKEWVEVKYGEYRGTKAFRQSTINETALYSKKKHKLVPKKVIGLNFDKVNEKQVILDDNLYATFEIGSPYYYGYSSLETKFFKPIEDGVVSDKNLVFSENPVTAFTLAPGSSTIYATTEGEETVLYQQKVFQQNPRRIAKISHPVEFIKVKDGLVLVGYKNDDGENVVSLFELFTTQEPVFEKRTFKNPVAPTGGLQVYTINPKTQKIARYDKLHDRLIDEVPTTLKADSEIEHFTINKNNTDWALGYRKYVKENYIETSKYVFGPFDSIAEIFWIGENHILLKENFNVALLNAKTGEYALLYHDAQSIYGNKNAIYISGITSVKELIID